MKKNKKLFAILTLVAFMMSLVPALAFAADATVDNLSPAKIGTITLSEADENGNYTVTKTALTAAEGATIYSVTATTPADDPLTYVLASDATAATEAVVGVAGYVQVAKDAELANVTAIPAAKVLTAKEIKDAQDKAIADQKAKDQAQADIDATISNNSSTIGTVDANVEIGTDIADEDLPELQIVLRQANGAVVDSAAHASVYVWAERSDKPGQVSDAFVMSNQSGSKGLYTVDVTQKANFTFKFLRAGEYTLKAAIGTNPTEDPTSSQLSQALLGSKGNNNDYKVVTVNGTTQSTEDYKITATVDGKTTHFIKDGEESAKVATGTDLDVISVEADTIAKTKVVLTVYDKDGKVKEGKLVQLSTSADNIDLDKTKLYTDIDGVVEFNIAGIREGNYKIYVKVGNEYESVLNVTVGSTAAADIKVIKEPTSPLSTDLDTDDYGKYIRLQMTDANGNLVTPKAGVDGAKSATMVNPGSVDAKYVTFVEKPEKSKLTEKDIWLTPAGKDKDYYTIGVKSGKKFDVEGDYTIKAVLDNGKSVTFSFEVRTFDKAVSLNIEYPVSTVELDGTTDVPEIYFVDANGVIKDAGRRVTVAANGYAVKKLDSTLENLGQITVKNDEKYIGQTITVTAIAERENLVATTTLTVADEAREVKFATTNGVVNANNKIKFNLVDAQGNIVAVGADAKIDDVNVVVTNVTNDARISSSVASTSYSDLLTSGEGIVNLTANKECTATVQVVVKATVQRGEQNTGLETKYYSGVADFTFGKEVGQKTQVVMSIGSHELVKNGVVSTIDAAPMIQDNRTFVPFRALAEAFGATVEFDATNNTVTAKLDGTTVVLTIGSSVMTVGDEAKTLDVAPFISGDRTMVPVRAVAEAFGFNVEATSNPDGTTADVVFTK